MQKRTELAAYKPFLWFPIGLTAVFSVLELVNILNHPMWRDELQVWMIARHSHSIAELISLKKYEGHPDAWFLAVYLITRLTSHPIWMQIFSAFVASITTYVIARYSPFTRIQKILIVFGYFLFFEYATISREYVLAVLALFTFCAVFRAGLGKNYLLLALLLGFFCQTSIYSVLITLALIAALLVEVIQTPSCRHSLVSKWPQLALAMAIVTTSVCAALLHIHPPPDEGYITRFNHSIKGLSRTLSMFWTSFIPIPDITRAFHSSNIIQYAGLFSATEQVRFMAFIGVIIFCFSALFFIHKPVVLFAYVCGEIGLLCFKQVVYLGAVWHDGFAFILFLACLWLASAFPEKRFPINGVERASSWFAPFQSGVLYFLLAVQAGAGVAVSVAALKIPFSQSRAAAEFIRANKMDRWTIIGDRDFSVSPIAGYLDREIYYVAGNRFGSFIIWDKKRIGDASGSVMPFAVKTATELHQKVLVILSYPAATVGQGVTEIAFFDGAIEQRENYYLYVVQPVYNSGSKTDDLTGAN